MFEIADSISNKALRMTFYASFVCVLMGAFFMVEQWPYGRLLLNAGLLLAFFSYFISFLQTPKTKAAYINLLLLFCFNIGSLLRLNNVAVGKYLVIMAGILFAGKFIKSMID